MIGVDCFIPYYPRELKEANLAGARKSATFTFREADICDYFAEPEALNGVDVVFHQAAQAGVRASWGSDFEIYTRNNILGTQKLLEACKARKNVRLVYASSSSVYGETRKFPMSEDDLPSPVSPYGVSKLAAEHLMRLYHVNYGVHAVSLRYFTVYGPRQRPDMAFHRLCRSVLAGDEFPMYGDGEQTRDFTYIDDIVQANIDAAERGRAGGVYNLGGGTRISMNEVIAMIEEIAGRKANIRHETRQRGDVTHTAADVARARRDFGFAPRFDLRAGLTCELGFVEKLLKTRA